MCESPDVTDRSADLAVVGLGPAGRALAHRAATAGLDVVAIDPAPTRRWTPTYALWVDELPAWLPNSVLRSEIARPEVWTTRRLAVDRPYGVLDNAAVREVLTLDGVRVIAGSAVELAPGRVTMRDGQVVRARTVVDARGVPRSPNAAEQSAYGVVLQSDEAAAAMDGAQAWFMDWRTDNGTDADDPASFLYAVPVSDDTVLLEETCLVGRPAMTLDDLAARLNHRLRARGVHIPPDARIERVRFAVENRGSGSAQGVGRFGARAGLVHPGTGYSVATSWNAVDHVVAAVASGDDVMDAVWSRGARGVRTLRGVGLTLLLNLGPRDTTAFFDAFFSTSVERQRALLSRRSDVTGNARSMWATFAAAPPHVRRHLVRAAIGRA